MDDEQKYVWKDNVKMQSQYTIGVDEGNGKDYSATLIMGGMACGMMHRAAQIAKDMQDTNENFMVHVCNLKELDYFIEHGIQPSNIHMTDEYPQKYHWTEIKAILDFKLITPDGIRKV